MRIVSGTHKSKRITAPKNLPVRPTTDMAKESLFNILNNNYYFDEVRVLDLFSGTGNISYEFASRGTEHILCIDENVNCIRFIQKTAKELGFESISTVKADAPYELEGLDKIVAAVFAKKILSQDGVVVIEHSKEQDFSELPYFVNSRRYGNVNFSFFEWEEEDEDEQEEED
jgi:16S rRNA (guanine966-N2)-methyltransferase